MTFLRYSNVSRGDTGGEVAADVRLKHWIGKASRGAGHYIPTKPVAMRNKKPLVSFTFDDVPESAFLNGARVLEQHGTRGTFYIAPGILGTRDEHWRLIGREQVAELNRQGHEIGCHTLSHVRVQQLGATAMANDVAGSRAALREICGDIPLNNFAYPFGVVSLPSKLRLQTEFQSCRGIYPGINHRMVDLALLRSQELYDRTINLPHLEKLLDETIACNGWLILYTHDVEDQPSWIGCSPRLLNSAVEAVLARGIECKTVAQALVDIGRCPPSTSP
jgi:peptidoglycan/xylan/chitin deacetylase (PgdA/CDA1 family)